MLKKLLEKRKALLAKIDATIDTAETEKRDLTQAELDQRSADLAEIAKIDKEIEIETKLAEHRAKQSELETRASAQPTPRVISGDMRSGLSTNEQRDLNQYSVVRALNCLLDNRPLDGIEGEMSREGQKELRDAGVQCGNGNFFIPQIVLTRSGVVGSMEHRDLTATGTTSVAGDQGGLTIQTALGSIIDRLRKKLVLQQLGVTMIGGLQGNIAFPKVTADDQAVEKAENATSAESSVSFGQINLSPRRLPVHAEVSRQLLQQSSVDIEAWLRNDLAFQIAQVMDSRGINGSGSSQPYGILNTVGVGSVAIGADGGAPTWDHIVNLESAVAAVDADIGALAYLTNTKVRGKLKRTSIEASTNAEKIWSRISPATPLNEYACGITNLVPSNITKGFGSNLSALAFGNFADALMAQWGGLEFLVNPYSKDTEGLIRINCWTFYDFLVRRVESFAVCKDIVTT